MTAIVSHVFLLKIVHEKWCRCFLSVCRYEEEKEEEAENHWIENQAQPQWSQSTLVSQLFEIRPRTIQRFSCTKARSLVFNSLRHWGKFSNLGKSNCIGFVAGMCALTKRKLFQELNNFSEKSLINFNNLSDLFYLIWAHQGDFLGRILKVFLVCPAVTFLERIVFLDQRSMVWKCIFNTNVGN